jgi:hypothetical protein
MSFLIVPAMERHRKRGHMQTAHALRIELMRSACPTLNVPPISTGSRFLYTLQRPSSRTLRTVQQQAAGMAKRDVAQVERCSVARSRRISLADG